MEFTTKEEKESRRKFRRGIKINRAIICLAINFILLFSLIFMNSIEILLKLKPDLSYLENVTYEIHFVNVGHGDAILLRLPDNKCMMVDSGKSDAFNTLNHYIDKVFFKNDKDKTFDYFVLSHSDSDHIGGMQSVINNYNIGKIYHSNDLKNVYNYNNIERVIHEHNIETCINESGLEIVGENYKITWLTPMNDYYEERNDYSAILYFEFPNYKFILTGDATSEVGEIEALNYFIDDIDVDMIKLGHHGSSTSTSLEFLEGVKPEVVIISNSDVYNHPASSTIETLAKYDSMYGTNLSNYYDTLHKGNIIVTNDGINTIKNINDYIFVDYYLIVIVIVATTSVISFIPVHLSRKDWYIYLKFKRKFFRDLKTKKK